MRDIAIYGAGGLGREVACTLNRINAVTHTWNLIGFFDDGKEKGFVIQGFGPCLGGIDDLNQWDSPLSVALCFGSPKTLRVIRNKITNRLIDFPNLIDPTCIITDLSSFKIGEGNILQPNCLLTTNVTVGDFNILNGSVSVGHDTRIGDFNVFMPSVKVSGEIEIGNGNLFGGGAFIKQQCKVGNGVILSPLSALLHKPKDNALYMGNPAKRMRL